jgi:hypothetical protein
MFKGETLSQQAFVKALIMLCEQKYSGTVFYHRENGLSARMILRRGKISWIAYHHLRGLEAIKEICDIDSGRMYFNTTLKLAIGQQDLPSTLDILKLIKKQNQLHRSDQITLPDKNTETQRHKVTKFRTAQRDDQKQMYKPDEQEFFEIVQRISKILYTDHTLPASPRINQNTLRHLTRSVLKKIRRNKNNSDSTRNSWVNIRRIEDLD